MFILSVLTAFGVLLSMILGAVVTYTFANSLPLSPDGVFSVLGHRFVAEGAGTLVVVLALWITFSRLSSAVKIMSWVAVLLIAMQAFIGMQGAPLPAGMGLLHAFSAQLIIAILAHIIMYTWPGWKKQAVPVPPGRPPLHHWANYTAAALLLQVFLGAAYRHNILSVVWHIVGAFFVIILGLGLVMFATQVPANEPVKVPAIWLVSLLGVQVTLGMILISLSSPPEHATFATIVVATHVAVGTSALATGIITSMLVRKCVKAFAASAQPAA